MSTVICNGDPKAHQCEKRKCRHRLPHEPVDQCDIMTHNWGRTWCVWPDTESLQHIGEDGTCVMCKPPEVVKAEKEAWEAEYAEFFFGQKRAAAIDNNKVEKPCGACTHDGEVVGGVPCVGCRWNNSSNFEPADSPRADSPQQGDET